MTIENVTESVLSQLCTFNSDDITTPITNVMLYIGHIDLLQYYNSSDK